MIVPDPPIRHYVIIPLPKKVKNYFDKITVSWIENIDKIQSSKNILSKYIERDYTVHFTITNSTYIDLKMNKRYQFVFKPKVTRSFKNSKTIRDVDDYDHILHNDKHSIYRIKKSKSYPITISWKIGLPKMLGLWAWMGCSGFSYDTAITFFSYY